MCVCVCDVFKHLFFLNKQKAQEVHLFLYVIYWQPGVPVPLDNDWRHLQICVSYTVYICASVCVCIVCTHVYTLGQCQHTDLLPSSLANYTRALKAT